MSELKQHHNQTVYTGGLNCPYLRTSVVLAAEAEAALAARDAEIARLREALTKIALFDSDHLYSVQDCRFMAREALEARG